MEKICVLCKHWWYCPSEEDWSELTPGADAQMGCYKNHWFIDSMDDIRQESELRKYMLTAEVCPDFEFFGDETLLEKKESRRVDQVYTSMLTFICECGTFLDFGGKVIVRCHKCGRVYKPFVKAEVWEVER